MFAAKELYACYAINFKLSLFISNFFSFFCRKSSIKPLNCNSRLLKLLQALIVKFSLDCYYCAQLYLIKNAKTRWTFNQIEMYREKKAKPK